MNGYVDPAPIIVSNLSEIPQGARILHQNALGTMYIQESNIIAGLSRIETVQELYLLPSLLPSGGAKPQLWRSSHGGYGGGPENDGPVSILYGTVAGLRNAWFDNLYGAVAGTETLGTTKNHVAARAFANILAVTGAFGPNVKDYRDPNHIHVVLDNSDKVDEYIKALDQLRNTINTSKTRYWAFYQNSNTVALAGLKVVNRVYKKLGSNGEFIESDNWIQTEANAGALPGYDNSKVADRWLK